MEKNNDRKGLFSRLAENKKAKKSLCCCCNYEIEEIPDEEGENNSAEKNETDNKGNTCF